MKRFVGPAVPVLSQLSRLGVVGGAALALLASTEAGDRANGTCPAGETCTPDTPNGLLFEGAPLGVWPALTARTIAAGGRQTFRLTYPDSHDPFDLPFVAKLSSPDHQVVATGADRVSIAAARPATGYLRILDASGELYDRLSIDSAEIASLRAAPAYAIAYPQLDPPRWATFAGGRTTVTVVLADAGGQSLVDEDLVVRSPAPSQRAAWDSFDLTAPAAGVLELAVDAGDLVDRRVRVAVVDVFDELQVSSPTTTGVGGTLTACFPAWLRGDLPSADDDVLVVGLPRQYHVTGPATPLPVQAYAACVQLHTDAAGTVRIDATAGGRTWSATIDVRGASPREVPSLTDALWAPSEGERAELAAQQP